jgi:hypothetical protein
VESFQIQVGVLIHSSEKDWSSLLVKVQGSSMFGQPYICIFFMGVTEFNCLFCGWLLNES